MNRLGNELIATKIHFIMTEIKMKRVYEPYDSKDGIRVLADALWPRGIKKETLNYDFWEKDIAPSKALRQWFHHDKNKNWDAFTLQYNQELEKSAAIKEFAERMEQYKTVTLIYAAKDPEHNHVLILKSFIEKLLNIEHGKNTNN